MAYSYEMVGHPCGWAVLENGAVVEVCPDRDRAFGIIQLLMAVAGATRHRGPIDNEERFAPDRELQ